MSEAMNFQSIIMTLQEFWAGHGCLVWQPYYTQVGAGTMNPGTFLRVLGPEPWKIAYVEPSIRPDDGRYGENPNRLQMHYQFQVILKPDPGNPQEIYLKSLEALGIDARLHDIRFVEDNWRQPALGAWGLGWEVWLDGQEITQFTYFQQAGGFSLDPVSVELTYGLERIAISLQRVNSFLDIRWNADLTDGDVNLQAEQEHSKYYFEIADVERLRQMYDLFETEAAACLDQGLVLPAYDYVLKCSHTFNILDTRGAVGVTERQTFFARMRELARRVSAAYLEQRRELGFPWLEGIVAEQHLQDAVLKPASFEKKLEKLKSADQQAPFLLEIGTEELPAGDLDDALDYFKKTVPGWLQGLRLEYGTVQVKGTPRRLVVYVEDLSVRQSDLEKVIKGPPAEKAFDSQGIPTKAAEGFARGKGVAVSDLEVREMDGGFYAVAVIRQPGRAAGDVLCEHLPDLIASLSFNQSMRWNSTNVSFSRPIRWFVALLGAQLLPFMYAGLQSDRITRGLRSHEVESYEVNNPEEYFAVLTSQDILLDPEERRHHIHTQADLLASEVEGRVVDDPELLAEVANLVEAPAVLRGSFDPSHLKLPREVLISVMKKHQRYFPVVSIEQVDPPALIPYFIAVRNGDSQVMELVIEGNQHVLQARFTDAEFFVHEDLKKPLSAYLQGLDTLTFQVELGSMLDKTRRIMALVEKLAELIGLPATEFESAMRAAELCKADLATQMVIEMTSLQGQMGRYYAVKAGESQAVAQAIFEHYLPRFAGDQTPESRPGLVVGIADRLDSLCGLFAAGLAPSGNKDPFALRRAALGLVQNLLAWNLELDLRFAVGAASATQPVEVTSVNQDAVLQFVIERLRNILLEKDARFDVVDAVLASQGNDPARATRAVSELTDWVSRPDWHTILPAYARCVRITRDSPEAFPVDERMFVEQSEKDLYNALRIAEATPREPGSVEDFLTAFVPMIPVINRFFDDVLVMVEDAHMQRNRLGLLQRIALMADGVADMSRLEGF